VNMPKWLADEIDELARRVKSGELSREEAIEKALEHVREKDDNWIDGVITATLSGKLDAAVSRLRKAASREVARTVATHSQGAFDEICSDFWPRDTFGPETSLEDLEKYAEEMSTMTQRYVRRDEERDRRLQELIRAAGGNKKMGWEKAERLRLGLAGGNAASG
jgi:hypothetical protein